MKIKYSLFCYGIPIKFRNNVLSDFDFSENPSLQKFVLDWINNPVKGFWLHGKIGLGKTMLLSMLCRIISCEDSIVFLNFSDLIETMKHFEDKEAYISSILESNYIIIDDFMKNFETNVYTDNDYRNLSRFIDLIYNGDKILLCSSMYNKKKVLELKQWDNMFSRIIEICDFVEIHGKDRRIR